MSRRLTTIAAVVALLVAYLAGYWPERQRRVALESEYQSTQAALTDAEVRVRAGALLGEILNVRDAVAAQNFGQAQQLSSSFFNGVRREIASASREEFRTTYESILGKRDSVTAALARGDAMVSLALQEIENALRTTLGYQSPAPSPS